MKKVNIYNHQFRRITNFSLCDRSENWWASFRCNKCGITGRKYNINDLYIYVTDSFSDNQIDNCKRDNFVDKYLGTQIQVSCKLTKFPQIPIYSIHTVVTAPAKFLNGERGVWIRIKGMKGSFQITFDECVAYPIKERKRSAVRRTKKVGDPTIPNYMKLQRVRTKYSVIKFIRTKPTVIKRKRTR